MNGSEYGIDMAAWTAKLAKRKRVPGRSGSRALEDTETPLPSL